MMFWNSPFGENVKKNAKGQSKVSQNVAILAANSYFPKIIKCIKK